MNGNATNSTGRTDRRRSADQQSTYYAHHDGDGNARLSTTVVHALADVMDDDVTETEFSLYDTIDPGALNNLFNPAAEMTRTGAHVAFSVCGYRVTVYSSGQIVITPPADDAARPARQ